MAFIYPVNGVSPQMGDNCFVAPNATIVGDVVMGNECSVWFNAVIRGDVNSILGHLGAAGYLLKASMQPMRPHWRWSPGSLASKHSASG